MNYEGCICFIILDSSFLPEVGLNLLPEVGLGVAAGEVDIETAVDLPAVLLQIGKGQFQGLAIKSIGVERGGRQMVVVWAGNVLLPGERQQAAITLTVEDKQNSPAGLVAVQVKEQRTGATQMIDRNESRIMGNRRLR